MSELLDPMNEAFEQRCRPRQFGEVCVLALDDDGSTDDLSWFSVGVDSKVRAGTRGFVLDLDQFSRQRPLKAGLGHLGHFEILVFRIDGFQRDGYLNWLHGQRFVDEWNRGTFLGLRPENFETEGEAVDALKTKFKARRIRADLGRRLTTCGLSFTQVANAAGLIEGDVRRIAGNQRVIATGAISN